MRFTDSTRRPNLFRRRSRLRIESLEERRMLSSTTAPELIKDISVLNNPVDETAYLRAFGNEVYFAADDGNSGHEIWKTDGTAEGTVQVKDIFPGIESSWPYLMTVVNNELYFGADDGATGYELWKTDGTTTGPQRVIDINPGVGWGIFTGQHTVFENMLYFVANDGQTGDELWKTDGTEAGTIRVADITPGNDLSGFGSDFVVYNDELYFVYGSASSPHGLWKTDGTETGTVQIATNVFASGMAVFNNELYFVADDAATGPELWKTNGTTVSLVADITPDFGGSWPRQFTEFNDELYFQVTYRVSNVERNFLWKTDGTTTVLFREIGFINAHPIVFKSELYFNADDGVSGAKLWKTDGTEVVQVADFPRGAGGGNVVDIVFCDELYFTANDGVSGWELWKTDGTIAGTVQVADLLPGPDQSVPWDFAVAGDMLVFTAIDGVHGREPWVIHKTNISLDSSNNLVISDTHKVTDDDLSVHWDLANNRVVINNPADTLFTTIPGSTGSGSNEVSIPISAFSGMVIDTGEGDDLVTLSGASAALLGRLAIDGGPGFDGIILPSDFDLTADGEVHLRSEMIEIKGTLSTTGSARIDLVAERNISLTSGARITTLGGDLTLSANMQTTPTSGSFVGIDINNAEINSTSGPITLMGRGGNSGFRQIGVRVRSGSLIGHETTGLVHVEGVGGASTDYYNFGVEVIDSGSRISSGGGDVSVIGTGGGLGISRENHGVSVALSGRITAGGNGTVTISGTGGDGSDGVNSGLWLNAAGEITSGGGDVFVLGIGGEADGSDGVQINTSGTITAGDMGAVTVSGTAGNTGNNSGIRLVGSAALIASGGGAINVSAIASGFTQDVMLQAGGAIASGGNAHIIITANCVHIASGVNPGSISAGTGAVNLRPRAGTRINLGGGDTFSGVPLTLGLTDGELDQITAGVIRVGASDSGPITVSQAISPSGTGVLHLITAGSVDGATSGAIAVQQLGINSVGSVSLRNWNLGNSVQTLAANTTGAGSGIYFENFGALSIGTVDGVTGIATNGGGIAIITHSPLTIDRPIAELGGGNIVLTAVNDGGDDDDLTVNASVQTSGGDGNIELSAGTNLSFAGGIEISVNGDGTIAASAEQTTQISTETIFATEDGGITLQTVNLVVIDTNADDEVTIEPTEYTDSVSLNINGIVLVVTPSSEGEPVAISTVDSGGAVNAAPLADAGLDQNASEGEMVSFLGSVTDNDVDDTHTIVWDFGDGTSTVRGTLTPNHTYADNGSYTVTLRVTDSAGISSIDTLLMTIDNVGPVIHAINAPIDPRAINTTISVSGSLSDGGIHDIHTAEWDWGDGTLSVGTITEGSGAGNVADVHTYSAIGIYTIKLTVDDGLDTSTSLFQFVVIYDPSAGFVTGAGWIDSPAGAYTVNPDLTGLANFGFNAKYPKGANTPDGQTQFQFKVGQLIFQSTSYQWLVVAGGNAKVKGEGTINGQGNYGFMLTGTDGQVSGGGGTDKFRIKIWDKANGDAVVYDNQMGQADDDYSGTTLGGGQIVIHSGGKKLTGTTDDTNLASGGQLTRAMLDTAVDAAIAQWAAAGVSARRLESLAEIDFELASFADLTLGLASSSTNKVWLDIDGAGLGWSLGEASGGYDLHSVVYHEIGHLLGYDHDVLDDTLAPGDRHLPGDHLHGELPKSDLFKSIERRDQETIRAKWPNARSWTV